MTIKTWTCPKCGNTLPLFLRNIHECPEPQQPLFTVHDFIQTWTCPQCDRTMDPILEFTHECTYNFTEPRNTNEIHAIIQARFDADAQKILELTEKLRNIKMCREPVSTNPWLYCELPKDHNGYHTAKIK